MNDPKIHPHEKRNTPVIQNPTPQIWIHYSNMMIFIVTWLKYILNSHDIFDSFILDSFWSSMFWHFPQGLGKVWVFVSPACCGPPRKGPPGVSLSDFGSFSP